MDLYGTLPAPEELARDEALAGHEIRRASLLRWLRHEMRKLYAERVIERGHDAAFVCADDARQILDAEPRVPPPERLNRSFLGTLFKGEKGWRACGFTKSRTAGSHANLLRCWRWVGG